MTDFLSNIKAALADLVSQENRKGALAEMLPGLLGKINYDKKYARLFQKRLAYSMSQQIQRQAALNKLEKLECV
jgi:hypothetical protein